MEYCEGVSMKIEAELVISQCLLQNTVSVHAQTGISRR